MDWFKGCIGAILVATVAMDFCTLPVVAEVDLALRSALSSPPFLGGPPEEEQVRNKGLDIHVVS